MLSLRPPRSSPPALFLGLLALSTVYGADAQTFDQLTRPVASLTRPSQIDSFLTELLIPPVGEVTELLVVDITANGFGPDDMIIAFPGQQVYPLGDRIPQSLQSVMKSWHLEDDYRLDATLAETGRVEDDAHRARDPRAAISGVLVNAIDRYYTSTDMDLRLIRRGDGLRLEMWNYDPDGMRYNPPPPPVGLGEVAAEHMQRFRFAKPYFIQVMRIPGTCVETRHVDGDVETRPCQ